MTGAPLKGDAAIAHEALTNWKYCWAVLMFSALPLDCPMLAWTTACRHIACKRMKQRLKLSTLCKNMTVDRSAKAALILSYSSAAHLLHSMLTSKLWAVIKSLSFMQLTAQYFAKEYATTASELIPRLIHQQWLTQRIDTTVYLSYHDHWCLKHKASPDYYLQNVLLRWSRL